MLCSAAVLPHSQVSAATAQSLPSPALPALLLRSVGVSARPAGQRDSTRRNTVARSAASEEGVDAAGTLHGEWPLLST